MFTAIVSYSVRYNIISKNPIDRDVNCCKNLNSFTMAVPTVKCKPIDSWVLIPIPNIVVKLSKSIDDYILLEA